MATAHGGAQEHTEEQPVTSTDELLQGQLELWHHAMGYVKSMALKCAIDLRIPDAIHRCGGTATLSDLLAAAGIPPSNLPYLRRLMRVLTRTRIFELVQRPPAAAATAVAAAEEEAEAVYALTAASRLLVGDGDDGGSPPPFSMRRLIRPVLGETYVSPFFGLHAWMKDERAAATSLFERAHGTAFWERMKDRSVGFNEAMAADTRLLMHAVVTGSPAVFQGLASLVDVGGGYGAAAAAVARAFPHVKCTVLELPHVVAEANAGAAAGGGGNEVRFVGGDMFEHIPPADAVLLKWVLGDWNDDACVKILRQCKKAIPPRDAGGKVIMIDTVIGSRPHDAMCSETQVLDDLFMMLLNGAEREEHEWRRIFFEAGFVDYKITPLRDFRSIIEIYP